MEVKYKLISEYEELVEVKGDECFIVQGEDKAYKVSIDAIRGVGEQGPQGEPGQDGKDGEQGPEGPQGPQGEMGPQGEPGQDGKDGEQGPQGPQGEMGPQGIQGEKGEDGYTPVKGVDYFTEEDMAHLATKEEIEAALEGKANADHEHEQYLTEHQDLSHLAVKEEMEAVHAEMEAKVEEKIAALVGAAPEAMNTLQELANAIQEHQDVYGTYVAQVSSALEGKANADHEHEQYLTEHQPIDHLATKEQCQAAHEDLEARLEEEIARAKAREDEIAAEIDDEEPYMADLKAYPTSKFLFACGHPVYVEGQEDGSVMVSYKWAEELKGIALSPEDAAKTYIVGGYGHDNHNSKRSLPMTKVVARNAKIKGIVGGHYFEGIVGHAVIDAENCDMVSVMAGGWCGANVDGRTTRLNIVHESDVRLVNSKVSSTLFGGSQGNGVVDDSYMMLKDVKAGWVTVGGSNGLTNKGQIEICGETEIEVLQTTNRGLVRNAEVALNDGHIKQFFIGGETEDSTVTGGIGEVEVYLMGGVVDRFRMGTSEGQPFAGEVRGSIFQCEVKESEVDMAQFEVVEKPVVVEYAEKDHEHEQYLTEHQDISHLAVKAEMEEAHAEIEARVEVLETINLETKPYIDKNGMLVLCGCPAVARGVGEEVHVSVRFFNNEEDKFVFTKDEFAKLRICMGYGAEGVGTKRNIVETTLELYDIDKVFIIDGGSQITGEIGTVNIIAERCNYIDGIQGARAMNGGERNIVHNFNVRVKDCKLIDTLFAGGNGYSVVWNNHVVVEGDTTINILIAGGSNGYTNKGDVTVEGGHIKLMHAVNRGIVNHARMVVNGGQVDHMYMGGDATMSDAGTVHHSEVHLMGGQVSNLEMGVNADKVSGQLMDCVVVEGDASMLEKVERPVDEVAELRAQVEALMARVAELEAKLQ